MADVRAPKTVKAATKLLEQFADVDGQIAAIEEARRVKLSLVNVACDDLAAPLITKRDKLLEKLVAWWPDAGPGLTGGARKSIALGGCEIGSRSSPATLGIAGDVAKVTAALANKPWSSEMVTRTVSIARAAVLKSIDGAHAKDLAKLGFSKVDGAETVFVKRVQQGGTVGAATT